MAAISSYLSPSILLSPQPSSPSKSTTSLSLSKTPLSLSIQKTLLSQSPKLILSTPFNNDYFDLLQISIRYRDIELAKAVHCSISKLEEEDTKLCNSLISAYIKLGLLSNAYRFFLGILCPNVVSYTAMISGFAKSSDERKSFELFGKMRSLGIEPNEYSFVAILTACVRGLEFELGFGIHGLVIKMGHLDCVFVANALMGFYRKCGCFDRVYQLFDEMSVRDIVSWNTVISGLVKDGAYDKTFELFRNMQKNYGFLRADQFSISTILTAASGSLGQLEGREIHGHALRLGFESNLSVNNALIGYYTICGSVENVEALFKRMPEKDVISWTEMIVAYMEFGFVGSAVKIFEKMPERNCVSYNALLSGFCRNGEGSRALVLFSRMVEEGIELTDSTLTSVLNACGLLMDAELSEQIHAFVIKFAFGSNLCIEAALIDMYTRCGKMSDAQKLFNQESFMSNDSIIWTSMLSGYARDGQPEAALSLFRLKLSEENMVVDEVESTAVLGVCGTLGFHEMGKQIHCHAIKSHFIPDLKIENALISMYSKCGDMDDTIKVFNSMHSHDIISWNSLITGHLIQRHGDNALSVWSKMEKACIKPDTITLFLIILAHKYTDSNLVDDCKKLFNSMDTIFNINPTSDHYAVFVGVLGHWGFLNEAEEVIDSMPIKPTAPVYRALLDSSRIHSNTIIGKRAAKHILEMAPQDPSTYILISNLYAASGRWHCSEIVRREMRDKGYKKHPSRSCIIHKNKVNSFYARDGSHPQTKDIYRGLKILILECMKAGYVPDTSFVLHEVEEHQKKDFLFYHSAKLAVTYGLLMSKPGKSIRVVKNIVLCGDCHSFLKYVSVVARKEIFLRDGSGFHCFRDGQCSCKDHW